MATLARLRKIEMEGRMLNTNIYKRYWMTTTLTKSIVLICCLVVFRSIAFADSQNPDGNDWNSWNQSMKIGYVHGFVDGTNGMFLGIFGVGDKPNPKLSGYVITGMTLGQIIDGINSLYSDFMNRSIPLVFGIYVVNKQIKGTPQEDLEKILLWLRSGGRHESKDNYSTIKDPEGKYVRKI